MAAFDQKSVAVERTRSRSPRPVANNVATPKPINSGGEYIVVDHDAGKDSVVVVIDDNQPSSFEEPLPDSQPRGDPRVEAMLSGLVFELVTYHAGRPWNDEAYARLMNARREWEEFFEEQDRAQREPEPIQPDDDASETTTMRLEDCRCLSQ